MWRHEDIYRVLFRRHRLFATGEFIKDEYDPRERPAAAKPADDPLPGSSE